MSKVLHSRLFRFLVCFLVICCILVNLSPLKAEATAVVGTALTLEGILALLFSMAMGVVAVDLTAETINRIGTDMEETIITQVDTSELQKWNNLKNYYEKINPDNNGPDDPLEWTKLLKEALAGGLLAAITGWLCTLVNMDGYEIDTDSVPDGWAIYGDYLYPIFPEIDGYPYIYLSSSGNKYYLTYTAAELYYSKSMYRYELPSSSSYYYQINLSNYDFDAWDSYSSYSIPDAPVSDSSPVNLTNILWSNIDILTSGTPVSLKFAGSEPKYNYSEVITPTYVGDIPSQIKNGELDEDDIVLPVVDPFKLITSPNAGANEINQMQQALKDGTITIDDYLKQVEVQDDTDTEDPTEAPTEDSYRRSLGASGGSWAVCFGSE